MKRLVALEEVRAIPYLLEAIANSEVDLVSTGSHRLAGFSQHQEEIIRSVIQIAREQPRKAIHYLMEGLEDEENRVRAGAAVVLGELRRDARESVAALRARLEDSSAVVRSAVRVALKKILDR